MRLRLRSARSLLTLLLVVLCSGALFAQGSSSTVTGRVTDAGGLVVVGARIQVVNEDTNAVYPTETNESGLYNVPALAPGAYRVVVEKEGFERLVKPGVELHVAEIAALNFVLKIGSTAQTLTVEGGAPIVNTTSSSLGGLVNHEEVVDMPLNGRNYLNLSLLQTGVVEMPAHSSALAGIWYSSNGAPLWSNNYLLDGASLATVFGKTSASISGNTLGIDGIQEYKLITNSFSAEYGTTMGSQMILVSRSGTNRFHGSAFEYLRNSALDAANVFDTPSAANGFQRLPPFRRNQFGGSLGGPIKKNKTFFFGTYEQLVEDKGVTILDNVIPAAYHVNTNNPGCGGCTVPAVIRPLLAAIPTPNISTTLYSAPFLQTSRERYGQIRVDQNISATDTAFARYTVDSNPFVQPYGYPQFTSTQNSLNQYGSVSENHIFSASLLNTFLFSFTRTNWDGTSPTNLSGPAYSFVPGVPMGVLNIGGVTAFGPNTASPLDYKQNVFSFSDDVFYTHGKHAIKFGALFSHRQLYLFSSFTNQGSITFGNISNFLQGVAANYSGAGANSILDKTYHYNTMGFYVQDDYRVLTNLTLNLGLRYEPNSTIDEIYGHSVALRNPTDATVTPGPPFKNNSLRNFGPRVGFAWDVFGDGKTSVRGAFGRMFDVMVLGHALANTLLSAPFANISSVTGPVNITSLPLVFPPAVVGRTIKGFAYDLKQPEMYQYNLTVERQLPFGIMGSLSYAGSRGYNLVMPTEGNPVIPTSHDANGLPIWTAGAPRVNTHFDSYYEIQAIGKSWYNSMQFGLIKRLGKVQFQSSYTWSKSIDYGMGQSPGDQLTANTFPSYPQDVAFDKGPSSFDVSQSWRLNAIYQIPAPHSTNRLIHTALSGWTTAGILSVQTGIPFTPMMQANRSLSGVNGGAVSANGAGSDRPSIRPGVDLSNIYQGGSIGCGDPNQAGYIAPGTPLGTTSHWYDPCAFVLPAAGHLGDASRNSLRSPGLTNVDFSLTKSTRLAILGEEGMLVFRTEIFNIFNHPNFAPLGGGGASNVVSGGAKVFAGTPTDLTENPLTSAGQIVGTNTSSRQVQFSLRVQF